MNPNPRHYANPGSPNSITGSLPSNIFQSINGLESVYRQLCDLNAELHATCVRLLGETPALATDSLIRTIPGAENPLAQRLEILVENFEALMRSLNDTQRNISQGLQGGNQ